MSSADLQPNIQATCLAFDLDDTIWSMVDTIAAAHLAMAEQMVTICPAMGQKYRSPAAFRDLSEKVKAAHPEHAADFTFVRKEAIKLAMEEFNLEVSDSDVDACFTAFFVQRNKPCFFPGALETLTELYGRGFRLGAVTDGNADVFKIPELKGLFDWAVTAGQVGCAKPDPRIFEKAIELAGCPAADMLYIGDNFKKDVLGPVAVGMPAIWVNNPDIVANPRFADFHWGAMPEVPVEPLAAAKAVVRSLPELLGLLAKPKSLSAGEGMPAKVARVAQG